MLASQLKSGLDTCSPQLASGSSLKDAPNQWSIRERCAGRWYTPLKDCTSIAAKVECIGAKDSRVERMTNKGEQKTAGKNSSGPAVNSITEDGQPVFLLEDLYPDAKSLFAPSHVPSADHADTLVSFDTNALLLPYNIGSQDLTALAKVLKELAESNRLFVADRVAREFIKNRDRKLADMLKALRDKTSRVQLPEQKLSPLLDGVEGYEDVTAASEKLSSAWKEYRKAQDKILTKMRDWRGTDPVSLVYNEVLADGRIVDLSESREALLKEWETRRSNKTPPGYKDSGKDDTGVGDFLIWKVLLKLGANHKKDLIFVTGEEKADWFVRSDAERVYPRPELVDEYRRASGGKSIRLSTLGELLEEMKVAAEVVSEVKAVERAANNAVQSAPVIKTVGIVTAVRRQRVKSAEFDYSTHDGCISVDQNGLSVDLRFSKASQEAIYFLRSGSTSRIARLKDVAPGQSVQIEDFDTTSSSYRIGFGEAFMALNTRGELLVGRITRILDDTRGDDHDEVAFIYDIFREGEFATAP
ncbi:DUF4935 domain-containing protein [Rhizobium sp. P32RR-XVIII]|uniref:PIN domain-containing protein n=1 Tax=Rhizobium sp. P32RR-XVIII TaxID=2726738 RepID=UPI001456D397|nr:PIN domain-containing protein [Rhizobium sp. P32RR-XVIII]NLS04331.1 DUF4935 domain-containing protein [Rhizobium sp. P32RR-XVIII]